MKNISDKTRKNLFIAGLGIICAALIFVIFSQFQTKTAADANNVPAPTVAEKVNPNAGMSDNTDKVKENEVVVRIDNPSPTPAGNSVAQNDQQVQNLQPEVTKPAEPSKSQKTDSSQKPSGEKIDKVQAADHSSAKKPDTSQTGEPKGGERKDGKVYLPGFGWVTETGGSGTNADDMYENGNKIGDMN